MPVHAAIYLQHGANAPPGDKQLEACIDYCQDIGYLLLAIVPADAADAAKLVESGRVDVIVAGYDSRSVQHLAARIDGAGRVEVIHPEPRVVEPPRSGLGTLSELILRWFRRGRSVRQIADDLDGDTTDVRAILRKYGEHPG